MKVKLVLIILVTMYCKMAQGQEIGNYKEVHQVSLNGFTNKLKTDSTKFYYINKDSLETYKITNIIFDSNGDTVSYQKIETLDFDKYNTLDRTKVATLGINEVSKVNIRQEGDKVFIYPFPYTNDTVNRFFTRNVVYLKLKERKNYSFKYKSYQLGAITIPVKWYINSSLGNVHTEANAMISGGIKWGKTHFVKLPHEKNARQYQKTLSMNILIGISKLSLDESNTKKENPVKGNVAAASSGLALGMHYQNLTFLIASGIDIPTSNHSNWKFTGIPWLGIGFGYNFLKIANTSN